ncbi:hypothetical protein LY78DRAFT_661680 [Colletotrichum sublineola]|nr:hypothetical protein LY78DRAFT_661680 [Colletotrichum sublineola]
MAFAVCCGLHRIALFSVARRALKVMTGRCSTARALQWGQRRGHDKMGGIFLLRFLSFLARGLASFAGFMRGLLVIDNQPPTAF